MSGGSPRHADEPVQVARVDDRLFVIRVAGRGCYQNAGGLKQLFDSLTGADPDTELIIDLERCTSLDSTFMGVLAGVGLNQRASKRGRMMLVNLNEHTSRQLHTLGLNHILDIRTGPTELPSSSGTLFEKIPEAQPQSRIEQIRMMIEAHERLIDAHRGNEVRFQGVLAYLGESLERAKQAPENH
ncbi:STAS domain-containing protein [Candidatus Sumerlaeota bacterium]|nr:STAS domain-containing protein [Candidatus Sumerlaeota bacterium]